MLNLAQPGKDVFPAHAGMSRAVTGLGFAPGGFPRTRGDEPVVLDDQAARALFSPHTRG